MSPKPNSSSQMPNHTQRPSNRSNSQPQGRKNRSRYFAKKKRGNTNAKPVRKTGPVKAYFSVCCSLPAVKPKCGQLESVVNPETKKAKQTPKGLGHWRCSGCSKACKVTVRKPVEASSVGVTIA